MRGSMKRRDDLLLLAVLVLLPLGSASAETAMTIVALGDSTTAGTPAFRSPVEAPPTGSGNEQSQYAYWMMRRHPEWKVLNRGVNGERSDQILRRFDSDVVPFHPQVLIVLAGVNDLYQGEQPDWVKAQLKKIYDRAARENIFVVACTIIPYNRMGPSVRAGMKEVNEWIRAYSAEHHLGFCDLFHVVENPAHPWNLSGTPDGLHPDVNGYRAMGEALADFLERHSASAAKPENP